MAIGKRTDKKVLNPSKGDASEKGYAGTTINSATISEVDVPVTMLKQYIEGSNWTVDYYNQLTGKDDANTPLDPMKPDTLQQYQVIRNLELKLTSPIDQDEVNEVTGTATVLYNIKPQQYDIIHAKVASGRRALFQVSEVKQKLYNMVDIYEITFSFLALQEVNPTFFTGLESKVVKEFFFDKTSLSETTSPILTGEELDNKDWCKDAVDRISKEYLYTFKNNDGYLVTDGFYDPYITGLYLELIDSSTICSEDITRLKDFWFMRDIVGTEMYQLVERNRNISKKDLHFIPTQQVSQYSLSKNIKNLMYCGIQNVVCKLDSLPLTDVLDRDFYLISSDTENNIYVMLNNYIDKQTLDIKTLREVVESLHTRTSLERYYEIPLLILFLKEYVANAYSNMEVHYG